MNTLEMKKLKKSYDYVKHAAKQRGIPWYFTFESWKRVWEDSGRLSQRGKHSGQYVMARYNDTGPYCPQNCRICLNEENMREAHNIPITLNGVKYESITQAAIVLGIDRDTLTNRLYHNKRVRYTDYYFG